MSLSNPSAHEGLKNPAVFFLKWDSQKGVFKYWDKTQEKEVEIGNKLKFMTLDELITVGGFSDKKNGGFNSSYYSNEIRNIKAEELNVFCKRKRITEGLWEEVKNDPAAKGIRYANSVYVALIGKNDIKLCNIKFEGGAVGAWISFKNADGDYKSSERPEIYKELIKVVGKTEEKTQGRASWVEPIFETGVIDQETLQKAIELDKELQEYLRLYFKGGISPTNEDDDDDQDYDQQAVNAAAEAEEEVTDELPF